MAGEILHSPKQFVLCLRVNVSRSKSFSLSSIQCKLKVLGHFAGCCVTLCASVERMVLILRVFLRVRSRSSHARSHAIDRFQDPMVSVGRKLYCTTQWHSLFTLQVNPFTGTLQI